MDRLQVGLIGSGIFAREAHAAAWIDLSSHAQVVAVWSRSAQNAQALAALLPGARAEPDLDALLARPEMDAVDIVLPIDAQPAVIEKALAAGKHVISEKPIAGERATAEKLIARWRSSGLTWMVAENWRYESAYERAAHMVAAGAIGEPLTAQWALHVHMAADNKYYQTPWRRTGAIPGGFLLDGGVHHVAAMRQVLGEVAAVQALVRQARSDLPPADTLSATLEFASGALGSYLSSFAAGAHWQQPLHIVGREGSLRVDRGWIELSAGSTTDRIDLALRDGVHRELAAFTRAVLEGAPHRNTPEEGLADLAVIEAMLESAQRGGMRVPSIAAAAID